MKFKIGDLICERNRNFPYRGCGIVIEVSESWLKVIKVYWFDSGEIMWEQMYHLEVYCENWGFSKV